MNLTRHRGCFGVPPLCSLVLPGNGWTFNSLLIWATALHRWIVSPLPVKGEGNVVLGVVASLCRIWLHGLCEKTLQYRQEKKCTEFRFDVSCPVIWFLGITHEWRVYDKERLPVCIIIWKWIWTTYFRKSNVISKGSIKLWSLLW